MSTREFLDTFPEVDPTDVACEEQAAWDEYCALIDAYDLRRGWRMNGTLQYLRDAISGAPKSPGPIAGDLRGWRTGDGHFICASCAGRIMARGCALPKRCEPIWSDTDKGDCVTCDA